MRAGAEVASVIAPGREIAMSTPAQEGNPRRSPSKTLRVRDIMTPDVITLAATTSVDDAARSLTFHQVTGAPVLERGRIVGVVSKSDLVDPRYRSSTVGEITVRDAMTRAVYAVRPGDPAMLAVRLMVEENVHRMVVVDDQGKLAGIVSSMDVLRALARGDRVQDHDPVFDERQEHHADPALATGYIDLTVFELAEGA
jgi:CBS-domain-containing membrane protein